MIRPKEWGGLFRGLGEALVDLAAAEFEALGDDLSRNGRGLGVALGFVGALLFVTFWTIGLLLATGVLVLAIWLQPWAAALVVLGLASLVGLILGWMALRRLRSLEAPTRLVKQRWEEHRDWWQTVQGALGDRPDAIGEPQVSALGADADPAPSRDQGKGGAS